MMEKKQLDLINNFLGFIFTWLVSIFSGIGYIKIFKEMPITFSYAITSLVTISLIVLILENSRLSKIEERLKEIKESHKRK